MSRSGRFRLVVGNGPTGSGTRGAVTVGVTNERRRDTGGVRLDCALLFTTRSVRGGLTELWLSAGLGTDPAPLLLLPSQ